MQSNALSSTYEPDVTSAPSPTETQHLPSFKLLIVDDDANLRLLLRLALTNKHYTIYEAANGEMALTMCLDLNPDLILLDIALPGMDGITVLQQIRQDNQTVCILMVSALNMQKWIFSAMSHGADGFIAKPLNVTMLHQTVAKHLNSGR